MRRKERHRTVVAADPDFGRAGVEIEGAFFGNFGGRIGGGENFDADLRSALEQGDLGDVFLSLGSQPGDVDGFDAGGSRNRAFRQHSTAAQKRNQKPGDMALVLGVERSRRRTHKEIAMPICLDAIREPGELGVGKNLGPASQVEAGLRSEIRKLNGDRHWGKIC